MSQIARDAPAALCCSAGFKFALCGQSDAKQNAFLTTLKYFLNNLLPRGASMLLTTG